MPRVSAGRPCQTLIVAALPYEVRPFLRRVRATRWNDLGLPAWEWKRGAAVAALSGMGDAAARRAAESIIKNFQPKVLLSVGFGGAVVPGLAVGDVVFGESFWSYDPDAGKLKPGPPSSPPQPFKVLRQALARAGVTAVSGSIVTTTHIIYKNSQSAPLTALPHPVLDLETVIWAETTADLDLPFLSIRAITDTAAEEIPEFLHTIGDLHVSAGARETFFWLAQDLRRIKDLVRLWHHSRCAARALAQALTILAPLLLAPRNDLENQPGQEWDVNKYSHPA